MSNKKLRRFNLIMGSLHLLQAIIMLCMAIFIGKIADYKPSITTVYLAYNPILNDLVATNKVLFHLPFGILVALFLFISAIFHYLVSIPSKINNIYNEALSQNINAFRWYEYALSSSIMMVLIVVLFGVYDLGTLIVVFLLNASMNLFGLLMEKMNQNKAKVNWLPFIFGAVAGLGGWIIVIISLLSCEDLSLIPWFVYVIAGSYFVLFCSFPINMILQYKKVGKWKDYLYGERGYIILSLVAKTLLAWLVFAGIMQP